jgi:hypothetical protein
MSAGAFGFRTAGINIVQTLLAKPDATGRSGLLLTREDLYGNRSRWPESRNSTIGT